MIKWSLSTYYRTIQYSMHNTANVLKLEELILGSVMRVGSILASLLTSKCYPFAFSLNTKQRIYIFIT